MTKIQTISFGFKGEANAIEIILADYKLGSLPRVLVRFFDYQTEDVTNEETQEVTTNVIKNEVMHEEFLNMTEEVYENWGTDDQVVIDWVLSELELTLA
jgi:hypothetical protein